MESVENELKIDETQLQGSGEILISSSSLFFANQCLEKPTAGGFLDLCQLIENLILYDRLLFGPTNLIPEFDKTWRTLKNATRIGIFYPKDTVSDNQNMLLAVLEADRLLTKKDIIDFLVQVYGNGLSYLYKSLSVQNKIKDLINTTAVYLSIHTDASEDSKVYKGLPNAFFDHFIDYFARGWFYLSLSEIYGLPFSPNYLRIPIVELFLHDAEAVSETSLSWTNPRIVVRGAHAPADMLRGTVNKIALKLGLIIERGSKPYAHLIIPPFVLPVLRQCNSPEEVIPEAIKLSKESNPSALRNKLKEYERLAKSGDVDKARLAWDEVESLCRTLEQEFLGRNDPRSSLKVFNSTQWVINTVKLGYDFIVKDPIQELADVGEDAYYISKRVAGFIRKRRVAYIFNLIKDFKQSIASMEKEFSRVFRRELTTREIQLYRQWLGRLAAIRFPKKISV